VKLLDTRLVVPSITHSLKMWIPADRGANVVGKRTEVESALD